ncbi:MAG: DUF1549 domain-containing protein [Acidobacteria bacterium]|nr:DUF1549 domain-containing protein [Acidobacteriota bacterium]
MRRFTILLLSAAAAHALHAADGEGFAIISRCGSCHGGSKPAGGLDLTTRQAALSGGRSGPSALTPKDAATSRIYQLAAAGKMPPGAPLSKMELGSLKAWIDAGAEWQEQGAKRADANWWSLLPLKPPLAAPNLDAILQARLSSKGLSFAPAASRPVLLRRATYDLHGLPPTPEEINAFVNDASPDAWARAVDRHLASPRYGERWARHWLDVARFCESQGYERDKVRDNIWPYRDYVIRAFNKDKPYSQFVREQIAGDVLQPVTHEAIAATAFLVAGPWDEVGNEQQSAIMKARVREDEYEDLIGTVSQTFLGLTTNCARCHDHKFDPILQRDYFGMKAIFAGISPADRPYEAPQDRESRLAAVRPHVEKLAWFDKQIQAFDGPAASTDPDVRFTFNYDARDLGAFGLHGQLQGGARVENGKLILSKGSQSMKLPPTPNDWRERTFEAWVKLADLNALGQQIVAIANPFDRINDGLRYGSRRTRQWGTSSEYDYRTEKPSGRDENQAGAFVHIAAVWSADHAIRIYRNGALSYTVTPAFNSGKGQLQSYPAEISQITIGGGLIGEIDEIRLYRRALDATEIERSFREGPMPAGTLAAPGRASLIAEQTAYRMANLPKTFAPPTIFTFRTAPPPPINVLERGDPAKPGEPVTPHFFSLSVPPEASDAQRRTALADWILKQPIAARVIVNRVWHYHFGRGIAATPNDLGFNGEAPSHPELIDWLAAKFIGEDGWSLKKLHRRILLSDAYRQSGRFDPQASEKDPENRLYWRFPAKRLEGEAVRDTMLQITGMLNPEMYGPSFKAFDVTVSNSHFYNLKDSDEAAFRRRSLYRMNVLSARLPLLESLDCPDPSMRAPSRGVTTTPLQALGLMNNLFVLRYAGHLAKRATDDNPGDPVRRIWQLALGRDPSPAEWQDAQSLRKAQDLTSVAWAVFNSNEFVYVE